MYSLATASYSFVSSAVPLYFLPHNQLTSVSNRFQQRNAFTLPPRNIGINLNSQTFNTTVMNWKQPSKSSGRKSVQNAADWTKWIVIALTALTVLHQRDASIILFGAGSVLNTMSAKLLKKVIRQPRPQSSSKTTHGMPSSHATAMSFLSLGALLNVLTHQGFIINPPLVFAAAVVMFAVVASWWRVKVGYHSMAQVVVGWLVGTVNCCIWCSFVIPFILSRF